MDEIENKISIFKSDRIHADVCVQSNRPTTQLQMISILYNRVRPLHSVENAAASGDWEKSHKFVYGHCVQLSVRHTNANRIITNKIAKILHPHWRNTCFGHKPMRLLPNLRTVRQFNIRLRTLFFYFFSLYLPLSVSRPPPWPVSLIFIFIPLSAG